VAAVLAHLVHGKTALRLETRPGEDARSEDGDGQSAPRSIRPARERDGREGAAPTRVRAARFEPQDTYRIAIGRVHGLQPGNIVGVLANEADLDGSQINGIDIQHDHSFVRLPKGMPEALLQRLQGLKVRGRFLQITPVATRSPPPQRAKPRR